MDRLVRTHRWGAALWLCVALPSQGDETKPDTEVHRIGDVSIELPVEWKVEIKKQSSVGFTKGWHSPVQIDCEIGSDKRLLQVFVYTCCGDYLTPAASIVNFVAHRRKTAKSGTTYSIAYDPIPHANQSHVLTWIMPTTYYGLRRAGRGVVVEIRRPGKSGESMRDRCMKIARSLRLNAPVWPVRVEGRAETKRHGLLFSVESGVGKKDVSQIMRCAKDVQKRFEKLHGAVLRPDGEQLVVFVSRRLDSHPEIFHSKEPRSAYYDAFSRRLSTVPIGDREHASREYFTYSLVGTMVHEMYGSGDPKWFRIGEELLAASREGGAKLPVITHTLFRRLANFGLPLDRVEATQSRTEMNHFERFGIHALVYVAFFHVGPKEYREAYKAFREEFRRTGDGNAAATRHLYSLDQAALLEAADRFAARKLKPSKQKKRKRGG